MYNNHANSGASLGDYSSRNLQDISREDIIEIENGKNSYIQNLYKDNNAYEDNLKDDLNYNPSNQSNSISSYSNKINSSIQDNSISSNLNESNNKYEEIEPEPINKHKNHHAAHKQTFHTKNRQIMIGNVLEQEREKEIEQSSNFYLHEKLNTFLKRKKIKMFTTQAEIAQEKKIHTVDIVINICVLIHVILSLVQSDFYARTEYDNLNHNKIITPKYKIDTTILIIRICAIGMMLPLIICICVRYHYILNLMKIRGEAGKTDNIFTTKLIIWLIVEVLFLFIFVPPTDEKIFTIEFNEGYVITSLDSILCLLISFKLLYIIRFLTIRSKWYSKEAKEIASNVNANITPFFVFKANLTKSPRSILAFIFISAIGIYSFLIRLWMLS